MTIKIVDGKIIHEGICIICNKKWQQSRPLRGTVCSAICRGILLKQNTKSLKPDEKRICKSCKKEFIVRPTSKVEHCSITCFNARPTRLRKGENLINICLQCNIKFKPCYGNPEQKYCSQQCAGKAYALPNKICPICNTEFKPKINKQEHCSRKCANNSKIPKNNLYYKTMVKTHCERCNWKEEPAILEYHHIDRNRKNNKKSNIIVLCPNCHTLDHFKNKDGQFKNNLGRPKINPYLDLM